LLSVFVPNLFCGYFRAKFILRLLECKIYFAVIFVPVILRCDAFWKFALDMRMNNDAEKTVIKTRWAR